MHSRSRSLRMGVAAAVIAGLALIGGARADGLSRFEQELKPKIGPEIGLTYGSASALGPSGFVLNDVRATLKDDTPGAAETPVAIRRIAVEDIDFDNANSPDGPNFLRMRLEGVSVSGEAGDWLKSHGLGDGAADLAIDYRLDPARKVFTLNRLEVMLPGLARLELSLIMDGVSPSSVSKPDTAMDEGSLRTATLVYEDGSLLAKIIPGLAAEAQKTPEALVAEGQELLAFFAKDQGPRAMAVFDTLVSYMADWRQPKGSLRITFSPPAAVSTKDMDKLTVTNAIVDVFGLSASYAGTRPGAALAAAAAPKPAPAARAPQAAALPPAGAVTCAPGQRLFALSDGGWWPATVREATQSSGRCVVRFDGTGASDDAIVTQKEMLAWSIDGPGKAATRCRKGDRVWKLADGAWYPAQVKQGKGANCVIELEDDDDAEEETVALKQLRVLPK
jgi:hypothetical protein